MSQLQIQTRKCVVVDCDRQVYPKGRQRNRSHICTFCKREKYKFRYCCPVCKSVFDTDILEKVYCTEECKREHDRRRHERKRMFCKRCNAEIPFLGRQRNKICQSCEEITISNFYRKQKCAYCWKETNGSKYCSQSCRSMMSMLIKRRGLR